MKSFSGKVAAITGAGSGMGRALALDLASQGANLALADVNEANLAETARLAGEKRPGAKVTTIKLDVSNRDAVYAWADQVVADHGKVNLIFNNAGVALNAPLDAITDAEFHWIMDINFWGVVYGSQAFLPHLKASGDGHVINTSSLFGLIGTPNTGAYSASKFAVRGYTESLRIELDLNNWGVSATCVHPGGVRTQINMSARTGEDTAAITRLSGLDPEVMRKKFDRALDTTTAESAATQILNGVKSNARRVLVGPDAKAMDGVVRLLGSFYQPLVGKNMKNLVKLGQRGKKKPATA